MIPVRAGRFIVLEGGEFSGKSTQARMLADRLRASGRGQHQTAGHGDERPTNRAADPFC